MSTISDRATWDDIPAEVIGHCLEYCTEASRLALGHVNRLSHSVVLTQCVGPRIVEDIENISEFSTGTFVTPTERVSAQAVCVALWTPGNHAQIRFRLSMERGRELDDDNLKDRRFVRALRGLTILISQMPPSSLKTLSINRYPSTETINSTAYHRIWTDLLQVALAKGCEKLVIEDHSDNNNNQPLFYFFGVSSSLCRPLQQLKSWLSALLPLYDMLRSALLGTHTERQTPVLREVCIIAPSFLEPPVLSYVLDILKRNAASITHLTLDYPNRVAFPTMVVKRILASIHLPNLKSFTFSPENILSPAAVVNFLSNHPTISELELECKFHGFNGPPPPPPRLKLPNLQRISTCPSTISWLLSDPRRCPELHTIHVKDFDAAREKPNAIIAVMDIFHAFPALTSPLKLQLDWQLYFPERVLQLGTYAVAHKATLGSPPPWTRVNELKIVNWDSIHYYPGNDIPLDPLVNWISLFPSLEHLEIHCGCRVNGVNEPFVTAVAEATPSLRTFTMFWTAYSRNAETFSSQVMRNGRVEIDNLG